jgi:hypothetical protein
MSVALCRHIKSNGLICRSPALRGKVMCFFHQPRITTRAANHSNQGRNNYRAYALQGLSPAEFQQLIASGDPAAIRRAVAVVSRALAANEIHPRRAGRILFGLQSVLNQHR